MWNSGRCTRLTSDGGEALVGRADLAAPEAVGLGPHDRLGPRSRPGRVLDRRGSRRCATGHASGSGASSEAAGGYAGARPGQCTVEDVGARHRPCPRSQQSGRSDHGSRVAVPGDVAEVVGESPRVEADRDRPHRRDGRPGQQQAPGSSAARSATRSPAATPRAVERRPRTLDVARRTRARVHVSGSRSTGTHVRNGRPGVALGPPFDQPADVAAEAAGRAASVSLRPATAGAAR